MKGVTSGSIDQAVPFFLLQMDLSDQQWESLKNVKIKRGWFQFGAKGHARKNLENILRAIGAL